MYCRLPYSIISVRNWIHRDLTTSNDVTVVSSNPLCIGNDAAGGVSEGVVVDDDVDDDDDDAVEPWATILSFCNTNE